MKASDIKVKIDVGTASVICFKNACRAFDHEVFGREGARAKVADTWFGRIKLWLTNISNSKN